MSEEFHLLTHRTSDVENELNRLGAQGWSAVNCWPSGTEQTICVLRRSIEYWNRESRKFQPCRPLVNLTLEVALARCMDIRHPKKKTPGIRLERLGLEFGADQAAVLEHLRSQGLKESEKLPGVFSAFVDNHLVYVPKTPDKNGDLWFDAKPLDKQKTPQQPTQPNVPPVEAPPKEPVEDKPPPLDFGKLVAFCMKKKPKEPGWPHSIHTATLAKEFGVTVKDLLAFLRKLGVPSSPDDPQRPFVQIENHLVAFKRSGKKLFFNVKAQRPQRSA